MLKATRPSVCPKHMFGDLPPQPLNREQHTVIPDNPKVGILVSTFGTPAYVALQLESRRQFNKHLPCLVVDDCSTAYPELTQWCRYYGAELHTNEKRLGHLAGDLAAFCTGLEWASKLGIDLLVKFSRRWLFTSPWLPT
jgi:hypothetical protein